MTVRPCQRGEWPTVLTIINAAAQRYRGVIPADCWHEPYLSDLQLERDIRAGVAFWACVEADGELSGVMGLQHIENVTLIRHAYVRPDRQGRGIGGALLRHLEALTNRQVLIGTWAPSCWRRRRASRALAE